MKSENNGNTKEQMPLNIELARDFKINKLKYVALIESTFHQTTKLESHQFYKPVSKLLNRNE
jgi:hypothetical protein